MTTQAGQCPFHGNSETRGDDANWVRGSQEQEPATASKDAVDYPVADWVDVAALASDPYPTYARLRAESPVAWVPQLNKFLVTSYAGCHTVEQDQEIFSANVSGATMTRAIGGQPMLRKDDPEHSVDRAPVNPVLRPSMPDQNRRRTVRDCRRHPCRPNSRSGDRDMSVVIIGGGQAGLQIADTLRTEGYEGKIDVIAEETGLPYQRPPLSKDYLEPGKEAAPLPLRGASFFTGKNVTLHEGVQALAIDRAERKVKLTVGSLDYDHLVFATGARNRMLNCPGASLPDVHGLKTLTDAEAPARAARNQR